MFVLQADNKKIASYEEQEASLKRITVLAAVVLPLSLACGLLSMASRAAVLGLI